ncbi:2-keto-4-pentenoate hydratase [Corynebacterium glutamicum]|uniref:2-keto-4-pentenoate hydratase n=1 Tax=Corynebacterium glutamicum TaxID=1718 RepID=UPI000941E17D|nr:fumarylacetoacetate hydrolase family protein [Corynebacterium glutamicum]OKX82303.1 hypothetical protein AUO95_06550 [Corynebacterium glutamicum]
MVNIEKTAQIIYQAVDTATDIHGLGEMSINDAYAVQHAVVDHFLADEEKLVGVKLGFTSRSKMEQMGVDSIIVGYLTDRMELDPAKPIQLDPFIHPKLEPELVFHLAENVERSTKETAETLAQAIRNATDKVAVGMELIDSRYIDFKFTLTDVIADNTSAAGFIVGEWQNYPVELAGRQVQFQINSETVESATTDAILGNPEDAFLELAKMVLEYDFPLIGGSIILAGSMTPAVLLESGQTVSAQVEGFPELTVKIAD